MFYQSFGTVLILLAVTAPSALLFGFGGATLARSRLFPLRWIGKIYISAVRGVPDIAFFLFFVIALDQGFEWLRHQAFCPDWPDAIRQGNDFVVCTAAKLPLGNSPQYVHEIYGFFTAVLTFAIVFGAFAANVLYGAMRAVPKAQTETAQAWHGARPSVSAHFGSTNVGLCFARSVESLDGFDQGHAIVVPFGSRRYRLLGT